MGFDEILRAYFDLRGRLIATRCLECTVALSANKIILLDYPGPLSEEG